MKAYVSPAALREMLLDGAEIALLDVREEGAFAERHLLWARSLPLSHLELRIAQLVPRRSARIVLCDEDGSLAERAARRLAVFGYADLSILEGGVSGWDNAGYEIFSGVNVPSKAFGEFVEHHDHTPNISADELKAMIERGEDLVVLDSRPMDEYRRMNIPTGVDCPGAELAYRVNDLAPSPETLVVVNCAGRTRSIIGAQSLINAGIPNRVVALRNGTMGWRLAGFDLEEGGTRVAPDVSPEGLTKAKASAARVAERFGIRTIDGDGLTRFRDESESRSLYIIDVRSPEEFERGHIPGSISAPGGQLVQATDRYIGTLNARVVLVDDTGVRATMTAHWLIQMGWNDVFVLSVGPDEFSESGAAAPEVLGIDNSVPSVTVDELQSLLSGSGTVVVDLATSKEYEASHIPGAWFAIRSQLAEALERLPDWTTLVFTATQDALARFAAAEAIEIVSGDVRFLSGGTKAWRDRGLPLADGAENLATGADDVWLRPYDRSGDVAEAMNAYLAWELDLVPQIERDGTTRFKRFPATEG